jgi:quinol monooxygenase YgiN
MFMAEHLTVIAYLTAKPGKEAEARKNIMALIAPTRKEKGCINYDLHELHGDATKFMFYENWESAEDLGAHAQSKHLVAFREKAPKFLEDPIELTLWRKIG